jgi:IclR family acetate operon transcriptional repressor
MVLDRPLEKTKKDRDRGKLKTVLATLDVFEYLASKSEFVSLTEISNDLGYPKGRIHRILSTLASRNYVRQSPSTRKYTLGLRTWVLGRSVHQVRSLIDGVRPELDELHNECQETVVLSVLDNGVLINLFVLHGFHPIHAHLHAGSESPIHATSSGKAILSDLDPPIRNLFLDGNLTKFTEYTHVDISFLMQELEKTRERGYANACDEWVVGVSAVSAPIGKIYDLIDASIAIVYPSSRNSEAMMQEFANLVMEKAKSIRKKFAA